MNVLIEKNAHLPIVSFVSFRFSTQTKVLKLKSVHLSHHLRLLRVEVPPLLEHAPLRLHHRRLQPRAHLLVRLILPQDVRYLLQRAHRRLRVQVHVALARGRKESLKGSQAG